MTLAEKIFGTHSSREIKMIKPIVDKIESLRPQMQALSDEELRDKTKEYKERLANGATLDDLLPEVSQPLFYYIYFEITRINSVSGKLLLLCRQSSESKIFISDPEIFFNNAAVPAARSFL